MQPTGFDIDIFIADFDELHGGIVDVVVVVVLVIVVVVIVTVVGSQYVHASSMRDVRPLNNAENSGKKKMKVDGKGARRTEWKKGVRGE